MSDSLTFKPWLLLSTKYDLNDSKTQFILRRVDPSKRVTLPEESTLPSLHMKKSSSHRNKHFFDRVQRQVFYTREIPRLSVLKTLNKAYTKTFWLKFFVNIVYDS